ncbi:MAG: hypothetical protein RBT15_10035, partial [Gudongella sp.]|nr:hypothetical protein [Gudongella sp.]
MGNFKILDLSDSKEWNDCFDRLDISQQDIYFTPEYYTLFEKLGEGKAHCFVYTENGEIAIYPFLLNSLKDLVFTGYAEYFDIQGAY